MVLRSPTQFADARRPLAAAVALVVPLGLAAAAMAETRDSPVRIAQAKAPAKVDLLKQHDQELANLRSEQKRASAAQEQLRREIEAIGADRRKLNQQLIDTAARVRTVEASVAAAEDRLEPLDDSEKAIRKSLDGRRAVITEVLAALQRMGRQPPPALMVSPEDALRSVRSAILLGAVVPQMRQEATALADELADLVRVRKEIAAERERLSRDLASISEERQRLSLLVEERQKVLAEKEKTLASTRQHAADLARQAGSLQDLIASLEKGLDTASRAAREKDSKGPAGARDPGRLAPAIAFASARGTLPLPVNGVRLREYGASDGMGGVEKGLSIATRSRAQVTAPCDGWVVYAGPFRSYGQLLILNAGAGYHVLLAGMDRISVEIGQFVLAGEPVAVMGSGSQIAAVLATGSSQPVLYVEFRKNGTPIDPSPWWATSEGEKVRG